MGFDKFGKIEDSYKSDLDNWLCNCYIEIQRIKMSDIKIHPETKDLYLSGNGKLLKKNESY